MESSIQKIKGCLYDILTAKQEVPDMSTNQSLSLAPNVTSGNKSVNILMYSSQIGQIINEKVVECLKHLDNFTYVEQDARPVESAEVKELTAGDDLKEVIEDVARVAFINRISLREVKKMVMDAYLTKAFYGTVDNSEASGILCVKRSYVSKELNRLGLSRKRKKNEEVER